MAFAADEKLAQPQTTKHRIIGLCSPDRQEDLRHVVQKIPEVQLLGIDFDKAEVSFSYDLAKLFPTAKAKQVFTVEQVAERLDNLLRNASGGSFTLRPASTGPLEKLTVVEFQIGILDCKGCRLGAYQAIARMDGVDRATVDSKDGRLTAWIDPAKTDRAAIEAALKKARVELPAKE